MFTLFKKATKWDHWQEHLMPPWLQRLTNAQSGLTNAQSRLTNAKQLQLKQIFIK